MRLYFTGHDCRYAAEQTLLTLFPAERPEYPDGAPEGDRCELKLSRAATYTTCVCRLVIKGETFRGLARVRNSERTDDVAAARLDNRAVKLAFYRAALASGVPKPEWGALTGVRPAKLMSAYLDDGMSARSAKARFRREYFVSAPRAELCLDAALASREAMALLSARDACLYIGIPFCPTRCSYCSFVSQSVEKSMSLVAPFLEALEAELDATAAAVKRAGLRIVSVYMGGGTPTTLSAEQLRALCGRVADIFDLSAVREYTVEAGRPDTITAAKLRALADCGVTRVSVNPQSMEDSVLEAIGRRHTAADILDALALVRAEGGFEVNMDLIAGLPSDTPEGFFRTIDTVAALSPENVTVHTLSLKRGSEITLAGSPVPSASETAKMLDYSRASLRAGGWSPYYLYRQKFMSGGFENVGWSTRGHENLYNICIMEELCSIIAAGAGGSTKLVGPGGSVRRFIAPKYPREYIDSLPRIAAEKIIIEEFDYGI